MGSPPSIRPKHPPPLSPTRRVQDLAELKSARWHCDVRGRSPSASQAVSQRHAATFKVPTTKTTVITPKRNTTCKAVPDAEEVVARRLRRQLHPNRAGTLPHSSFLHPDSFSLRALKTSPTVPCDTLLRKARSQFASPPRAANGRAAGAKGPDVTHQGQGRCPSRRTPMRKTTTHRSPNTPRDFSPEKPPSPSLLIVSDTGAFRSIPHPTTYTTTGTKPSRRGHGR